MASVWSRSWEHNCLSHFISWWMLSYSSLSLSKKSAQLVSNPHFQNAIWNHVTSGISDAAALVSSLLGGTVSNLHLHTNTTCDIDFLSQHQMKKNPCFRLKAQNAENDSAWRLNAGTSTTCNLCCTSSTWVVTPDTWSLFTTTGSLIETAVVKFVVKSLSCTLKFFFLIPFLFIGWLIWLVHIVNLVLNYSF